MGDCPSCSVWTCGAGDQRELVDLYPPKISGPDLEDLEKLSFSSTPSSKNDLYRKPRRRRDNFQQLSLKILNIMNKINGKLSQIPPQNYLPLRRRPHQNRGGAKFLRGGINPPVMVGDEACTNQPDCEAEWYWEQQTTQWGPISTMAYGVWATQRSTGRSQCIMWNASPGSLSAAPKP